MTIFRPTRINQTPRSTYKKPFFQTPQRGKTESVKNRAILLGSSNHLINPSSSRNWFAFETSTIAFTKFSPNSTVRSMNFPILIFPIDELSEVVQYATISPKRSPSESHPEETNTQNLKRTTRTATATHGNHRNSNPLPQMMTHPKVNSFCVSVTHKYSKKDQGLVLSVNTSGSVSY